jgi:hypothetical protein
MSRDEKIAGIRRRIRAWLFFIMCGLAVIWFGDYLNGLAEGMGDSIGSLGFIWVAVSVLLFIVNLIALQIEKKKQIEDEKNT